MQQKRSERRLAGFLDAAADLIGEVGYEAATMTAIAERTGTSIGGLYHYFPDKQSIGIALMMQYGQELEDEWRQITEGSAGMTLEQFANCLMDGIIAFISARPAYLKLVAARLRTTRDEGARRSLRMQFVSAFQARNPALSEADAFHAANVSIEIVKGMRNLYLEANEPERTRIVADFKNVLALYLRNVLGE